jgi:hypothetical protein
VNEYLRDALSDYFEAGDFADCIGVTVGDIIDAFSDEVEAVLDELKEIIEWIDVEDIDD